MKEATAESWGNIDQALRTGLRGFPKGWSLPRLLAERRGHRDRKALPKYSIAQILRWADQYYSRMNRWPVSSAGAIHGTKGETWWAVDMALRKGRRGLPGGSSLAQLLAARRKVRHRLRIRPLSIKPVLRWADAHKRRTGNWPTAESGPIFDASGETWNAIDRALRKPASGFRTRSSLFQVLLKHRGVGRHARRPPYTIREVLRWADDFHRRTGAWPKATSGAISGTNGETWLRVATALREGRRGLPGGSSLAKLLAGHRGVRNIQALPRLSKPQIAKWITAYYRRHRRLPNRDSGVIPGSGGEKWYSVDVALKSEGRGLKGKSSVVKMGRHLVNV